MKTLLKTLSVLALLFAGFVAGLLLWPLSRSPPEKALAPDWQPEPGAGDYAMRASECYACHTAEGGDPFAGGHPIESPLGRIYTSNITPDPVPGIGGWSLDEFRAALIDGQSAQGIHLYPAMPYENYRLLAEEDIRALYVYLRDEVTAVANQVPEPELPFPFNQCWGLRALNWLLLRHDPGHRADMGDDRLNRWQYLVDAPGHCAACHSPRTFYMGQDGLTRSDQDYLTGGVIYGWKAPPLRGPNSELGDWSVADLADFLATGCNRFSTANGEMAMVVDHSLQHLEVADILAMAGYLKVLEGAVDWPHDWPAPGRAQVTPPAPCAC